MGAIIFKMLIRITPIDHEYLRLTVVGIGGNPMSLSAMTGGIRGGDKMLNPADEGDIKEQLKEAEEKNLEVRKKYEELLNERREIQKKRYENKQKNDEEFYQTFKKIIGGFLGFWFSFFIIYKIIEFLISLRRKRKDKEAEEKKYMENY